ncbi:hypothetical protein BV25DRAFT_1823268 [Artomyces pyxidatus]|uniref:Uncharacterized protein n=1 Tax=Artomyces pyxidatus TaxID=48021 RepID=A0ACB8T6C9_9AGAM|nr:hypothetical protein BV25DRAFT_1823268 [Artomyces pyxidatus]
MAARGRSRRLLQDAFDAGPGEQPHHDQVACHTDGGRIQRSPSRLRDFNVLHRDSTPKGHLHSASFKVFLSVDIACVSACCSLDCIKSEVGWWTVFLFYVEPEEVPIMCVATELTEQTWEYLRIAPRNVDGVLKGVKVSRASGWSSASFY